MNYRLPTSVEIDGTEYSIRTDYRAILDIVSALNDIELINTEKALVTLEIFYEDFEKISLEKYEEALQKCFEFIDGGQSRTPQKSAKLVDWEQDIQLIISPINRVAGCEIRSVPYMHWWTFLGYYYEIGDCLFAQVVRIRSQLSKGRSLDKFDREWYRENKDIVDFKQNFTEAEINILEEWGNTNGQ